MYRILSIILLVILSILLFAGCEEEEVTTETPINSGEEIVTENINQQPVEEAIYKEYDYPFDNSYAFSSIYSTTKLTVDDILSQEEVEKEYNLSDLEGVTYEVRRNNEYEVAIIKIKNTDQSTQLLRKVSSRIQKTNAKEEEVAIEQNKGVLTLVIGEKAAKVSELLTKQFIEL